MGLITTVSELCFAGARLCLGLFLVLTISVPCLFVLKALWFPRHDTPTVTTSMPPRDDARPTPTYTTLQGDDAQTLRVAQPVAAKLRHAQPQRRPHRH